MTTPAIGILRQPGDGRPFSVGSSRVEVNLEGTETDGRFSMIQWEFPAGAPAPPQHIHHDASETFYVIEGELAFPLGERIVKVGDGFLAAHSSGHSSHH
jgi:mannose-6-phosphate isomerase-like protein (cupin superfamily)